MRITREDAKNYTQFDFNFFSLTDNNDSAEVRFMYKALEDIQPDAVHQVKVNGKDKFVDCLRQAEDPLEKCPFCKSGLKPVVKYFLEMFVISKTENGVKKPVNQVCIWTRGGSQIIDIEADIEDDVIDGVADGTAKDLSSFIVKITRKGVRKDSKTRYKFKVLKAVEGESLEDLPEEVELRAEDKAMILVKTAEEMEYYLENEEFEEVDGKRHHKKSEDSSKIKRRGSSRRRIEDEDEEDDYEDDDD